FHHTHLISSLLCLKTIIYIALSIWPNKKQTSETLMQILILAFSACEAGAGLAILVASRQTRASNHLHNLNLLQCKKLFYQQ
uniref:NADH-ubiquinone oxidoreductase chain 4L n=1 Tax=Melopsittacus undulatus TaxID=13146 RepID=A0A8C6J0Q6_MELUD